MLEKVMLPSMQPAENPMTGYIRNSTEQTLMAAYPPVRSHRRSHCQHSPSLAAKPPQQGRVLFQEAVMLV